MIIVLLGPPGAGKGTQCKRVIEKYGLKHLSSGDILRAQRASGTELGKKAQSFMDSGALVPDDVIIDMMAEAINQAGGNCVLDGFPRTVVQAKALDIALEKAELKIDAVVNLQIDDAVVAGRMTGRRSCPGCGAVFHMETLKPRVEGICDSCGQSLVQRKDDELEVVKNRLRVYHHQTAVVVGHYRDTATKILDINADGGIDEITAAILGKLDNLAVV